MPAKIEMLDILEQKKDTGGKSPQSYGDCKLSNITARGISVTGAVKMTRICRIRQLLFNPVPPLCAFQHFFTLSYSL